MWRIPVETVNLTKAVPLALNAAFMNNGQACISGSRLLVPKRRLAEAITVVKETVAQMKVGDPADPTTVIGPLANRNQYERIQNYIRLGLAEGATLITGGEGRPAGLEQGYFVKPTVFADVRSEMTILTYGSEEEAIDMANDTVFGLHAYVMSSDPARAKAVATRLQAGRVMINTLQHVPLAPFGGFKQSGVGREYGVLGLESYLEAKTLLGVS
jgi:aldehyde dehydrogenase (NAD+)